MPLMETAKDRQNEQRVAKILEDLFDCEVLTTPTDFEYDFVGVVEVDGEDEAVFVGELKCRDIEPFQYPDVFLSKDKREDVERTAKDVGAIPVYIVKFKDGSIWIAELGEDKDFGRVQTIGRNDRGLKKDKEPGYKVKKKHFEKIYGK